MYEKALHIKFILKKFRKYANTTKESKYKWRRGLNIKFSVALKKKKKTLVQIEHFSLMMSFIYNKKSTSQIFVQTMSK